MSDKKVLLTNIEKIHTTELGVARIARNLKIESAGVIDYCKKILVDTKSDVFKKGKNYYCTLDNIVLTINSYSYTIITAHYL